jgi:hypothetical protein
VQNKHLTEKEEEIQLLKYVATIVKTRIIEDMATRPPPEVY